MEIIIITLLLVAIGLLLYMAIPNGKRAINKIAPPNKPSVDPPDIVGKPNPAGRQSLPTAASYNRNKGSGTANFNFDAITEARTSEVPQEEPTGAILDWKEEEEELERYVGFSPEEGLATGVTFDELATVGMLLERKALEPSEMELAVSMISKIDGTELLGLLESRMEDASKKIAMLLDRGLTGRAQMGSSNLRNND